MDDLWRWYYGQRGQTAVDALKSRGFEAAYFPSREHVCQWLDEEVEGADTIGVGGSLTIRQLGVLEQWQAQGRRILDHWKASTQAQSIEIRHQHLACDLFLSSANAITQRGEIVNVDGAGNRVCATIFGPKRVIIVAGVNKLVPDLEAAQRRIREMAAPLNAKRLGFKTPCAETGQCTDCNSPQRICNITVVLHRRPMLTPMKVAIVGQHLGL